MPHPPRTATGLRHSARTSRLIVIEATNTNLALGLPVTDASEPPGTPQPDGLRGKIDWWGLNLFQASCVVKTFF
jgi:hypothetical protein